MLLFTIVVIFAQIMINFTEKKNVKIVYEIVIDDMIQESGGVAELMIRLFG